MMRIWLACIAAFPWSLFGDDSLKQVKKMVADGHYKQAIKAFEVLVPKAEGLQKGEALKLLAETYYKDQEHVKAFETYLKSLDASPLPSQPYANTDEEKRLYQEALKVYLSPLERDSHITALKIRDLYAGIWRLHPHFSELGFLVAIAYANLGDYPEFFDVFFRSYQVLPEHFLAYKTRGILHIKLYERARTKEEKEQEQKAILFNLKKAKDLFPSDSSLYKMEIAFSLDKEQHLMSNLKEIIDKDIVIPRSDLSFYIDQMLSHGKKDLAIQFLARARKWYPYSRTLDAAEEMIQEKIDGNRGSDGSRSAR